MRILEQVPILSPCFAYSTFLPFFLELTKNESHSKGEILNSSMKAKAQKKISIFPTSSNQKKHTFSTRYIYGEMRCNQLIRLFNKLGILTPQKV